MDLEGILTAVSTVGFPIVCTGALFWQLSKEQENHKVEMNALKDVITQNTIALTELREKLDEKL